MAQGRGFGSVAEAVETQGKLSFLSHAGCDIAQGYRFSQPRSPQEFEQFARRRLPGPVTAGAAVT